MKIKSSRILTGWNSPTKFLMPDELELLEDRVKFRNREWLGLKREEESIHIDRIASIRIREGLLKSTVVLETFGGANADLDIHGVSKSSARAFREALQRNTEARAQAQQQQLPRQQ
jgi:hypothetical protein